MFEQYLENLKVVHTFNVAKITNQMQNWEMPFLRAIFRQQYKGGFMPSVTLFGSHGHRFGSKFSML